MSLVKVGAVMCDTCIFRPDSPLADRVDVLEEDWRERDTHQVCHAFAISGDEDDPEGWHFDPETGRPTEPVVCRGFYEHRFLAEGIGQLLRIARRLDLIEFVEKEGLTMEALIVLLIFGAIVFAIAYAFGAWGRALMRNRGRSPVAGFLLGFLFGLLGVLICALMPANKDEQDRQARERAARAARA